MLRAGSTEKPRRRERHDGDRAARAAASRRLMKASQLLALAWRESRTARRRLLLYMSSISLGVAALVAIDSFASNTQRSVREQARSLLGGDIALSSHTAYTKPVLAALERDGYRPGRDVAVIAVCTDDVAGRQAVKLTSIALEPERTSALAVDLALRLLEGLPLPPGASPYLIEPRLVRRHSTFVAR